MQIQDYFTEQRKKSERDQWRPTCHFTPSEGWMNDPNGLIYFKEWYHLFYQYNPKNCEWGSMHWGHAVSRDMLHWYDLPIALYPDQPYVHHSDGGCFSGSAVEKDGILYCFYTSVAEKNGKMHQSQSLALSEDGVHFRKYEQNPVIPAPPDGISGDFRDPKVLQIEKQWYMVLGASAGGADVVDGDGRILLYRSEDLLHWEYVGNLLKSDGRFGTMMECPDLFQLNGKWVLTCSPMYHPDGIKSMYCVGDIDFETCQFDIQKTGNIDVGFDYYAPQSFLDKYGNRVIMAWENEWPWMPWFQGWGPTTIENWRGIMSVPRSAKLDKQMNLFLYPIDEFWKLQMGGQVYSELAISEEKYFLQLPNPYSYTIQIEYESKKITSKYLEIGLWAKTKNYAKVSLDLLNRKLYFDKHTADVYGKGVMTTDLPEIEGITKIMILIDHSNVEIYINDGIKCISCNAYPEKEQTELWIRTPYKDAVIKKIEIRELMSVWE